MNMMQKVFLVMIASMFLSLCAYAEADLDLSVTVQCALSAGLIRPIIGPSIVKPSSRPALIAQADLAKRLRLRAEAITILNCVYAGYGMYKISLASWEGPKTQIAAGTVNPQPTGTFTYFVRAVPQRAENGFCQVFRVETVVYFDGSCDKYSYNKENKVEAIKQYTKNGLLKATISYRNGDTVSDKIQSITHFNTRNSLKYVKYVDNYQYDKTGALTKVERIKEAGPMLPAFEHICTFEYKGDPGLERISVCRFDNGMVINYEKDLPVDVMQITVSSDGKETAKLVMSFTYIKDKSGNIRTTIIKYPDGRTETVIGLIDAADYVYTHIKEAELLTDNQNMVVDASDNTLVLQAGTTPKPVPGDASNEVLARMKVVAAAQAQLKADGVKFSPDLAKEEIKKLCKK